MQCPFCQAKLSPGRIDITRTTVGAITDLLTGDFACMPHYLHFYPEGDGETICLDHSRAAFHCRSCEALIIAGTKMKAAEARTGAVEPSSSLNPMTEERSREEPASDDNPSNCPGCGAAIEPEQARCPECDIALK